RRMGQAATESSGSACSGETVRSTKRRCTTTLRVPRGLELESPRFRGRFSAWFSSRPHISSAAVRSSTMPITAACTPSSALASFHSLLPFENAPPPPQEELVATTRTPGITVLADGRRFIDKRHLGVRIGPRVGAVTQAQAEERLDIEIARVQCDLARKAHASPTFTGCAARYVAQSRSKRSIDVIKRHVTLLLSYIGDLD